MCNHFSCVEETRQPRKTAACANQTLSVGTGRAQQASSNLLNSIQKADQIFPRKVVDEQPDGRGDRKSVCYKVRDGKIEKTRNYNSKWC